MKNFKLSKNEMKQIFGGAQVGAGSTCSTTCKGGNSISVTCSGGCTTSDKEWVACTGTEDNSKTEYCPSKEPQKSIASSLNFTVLAFSK